MNTRAECLTLYKCVALGSLAVCTDAAAIRKKKKRGESLKYTRSAISRNVRHCNDTGWRRILLFGRECDFLLTANFPKDVLLPSLLPLFADSRKTYMNGSPYRKGQSTRGRKTTLESIDLLGLALCYLKGKDAIYKLCPVFGVVPSCLYLWLDYSLEVLLITVTKEDNKLFEVIWPTPCEMNSSSSLLQSNRRNGHLLCGVFAVLDGARMPCQIHSNALLQNSHWEGLTQGHEVKNLFVWNFYGEIIHAAVNFPGSWHDSKVAAIYGLYYPKLSDLVIPPGFALIGDSAFQRNAASISGKIIRARKDNEGNTNVRNISDNDAAVSMVLDKVLPIERQSAEWVVRSVKGVFTRVTVPLSTDAKSENGCWSSSLTCTTFE